jgi:hypothetical protein
MAKTLKIVNGDIVRSYTNNSYVTLDGKDKVKQDVANILTTDLRRSTGLGCNLDSLVGEDSMNPLGNYSQFPVVFNFQTNVRLGLERLRNTQRNYLFDKRTNQELIYDFSPADVWFNADDPRSFRWKVDILTEDGRSSFSISGAARS